MRVMTGEEIEMGDRLDLNVDDLSQCSASSSVLSVSPSIFFNVIVFVALVSEKGR